MTDIVYFTRSSVTDICRYRLVYIGVYYRLVWFTDIVKLISYRWLRFCMLGSVITDICWYRLINIGHHYQLVWFTDIANIAFISVIIIQFCLCSCGLNRIWFFRGVSAGHIFHISLFCMRFMSNSTNSVMLWSIVSIKYQVSHNTLIF